MNAADVRQLAADDATLAVGMRVTVRWGYGSSFRAKGLGEIVKVNGKSVQVRLLEPVGLDPSKAPDWPAGFVLTGIARFSFANIDRWNHWNSVEPIRDANSPVPSMFDHGNANGNPAE